MGRGWVEEMRGRGGRGKMGKNVRDEGSKKRERTRGVGGGRRGWEANGGKEMKG